MPFRPTAPALERALAARDYIEPTPVQDAVLEPRGQVVVERDGVEVAGDHDTLAAPQVGAGDHGVPAAGDRQVRQREQRRLDSVGDLLLVVGDGLDVDELLGEGDDVGGEIEVRHGINTTSRPCGAS